MLTGQCQQQVFDAIPRQDHDRFFGTQTAGEQASGQCADFFEYIGVAQFNPATVRATPTD